MKALSIKQPWANLIASGFKTIETRKWKTKHRGQLLIVSSKLPDIEPFGKAIAVCDVVDCQPMTLEDELYALCDWYDGAFSWKLENIKPIVPFEVRGKPGMYTVKGITRIIPKPSISVRLLTYTSTGESALVEILKTNNDKHVDRFQIRILMRIDANSSIEKEGSIIWQQKLKNHDGWVLSPINRREEWEWIKF